MAIAKSDILEAFDAEEITTQDMQDAITDWFDLYFGTAQDAEEDTCQRIAYTIVTKLTKTCFSEYKTTTAKKDEFCQSIMDELDKVKKKAMQTMLVGGEAWIKPIPAGDHFRFNVVRRDAVFIFGRDSEGHISDVGTIECSTENEIYYTLLERRTVAEDGKLTIKNRLYASDSDTELGGQVSLTSYWRYQDYQDEYTYDEPFGIGLIGLRTPMENCVDGSEDACSVYAAAAGLIHNIDHNEWLLNQEFETGRRKLVVSRDMLDASKRFSDDLFTGLDGDPTEIGIHDFSPAFRDASFLNRKTEYLRNIENLIGIKRGLLSEVEAAPRTAREITSSEGDYNLTIKDLQDVWLQAVKDTVTVCAALGRYYGINANGHTAEDVVIDYGNGVLYDEDKTWAEYLDMVARGLLKPEIALGWRFNMPTETDADLEAIRTKYMPQQMQMLEDTLT